MKTNTLSSSVIVVDTILGKALRLLCIGALLATMNGCGTSTPTYTYRIYNDQKHNTSLSYISVRTSGGYSPSWVPQNIQVDGRDIGARWNTPIGNTKFIGGDTLYPVKPGMREILVFFGNISGHGLVNKQTTNTVQLEPGKAYAVVPIAFTQPKQGRQNAYQTIRGQIVELPATVFGAQ